ncbi:MAG: hypothetical protein ACFB9M_05725 [Myxococcota bacterium]
MRLLLALQSWAGPSVQRFEDGLDEAFGLRWAEACAAEPYLALDAIAVFQASESGPVYGFLDAVPEAPSVPKPMVVCEDTETRFFAPDAVSGLERLHELRQEWDDDIDPRLSRWLRTELRTVPDRSMRWPPAELPAGYRYVHSADGFGIIAPNGAFDRTVLKGDPSLSISEHQEWATRLLHEGKPGSALLILKDGLHVGRHSPSTWAGLGRITAEAYLTLGRPAAAQRVRQRSARRG